MSISPFFSASSIAIIGASRTPGHIGNVILQNFIRSNYPHKLYPINPNAAEIYNIKCYPSVLAVKEPIELAVIAVPANLVIPVIKECAKKKIQNVIIVSAGFAEVGNKKLQEELKKVLTKNKIHCIGPNCLGIFDTYSKIDTVFIPRDRIRRPLAGNLTIISQSGALGSTLLDLCSLESIGVSKFISYGNAVDIDVPELLTYLENDTTTKSICIYIEGLKDGKAFLEAAKKVTKKKPIIVLKGGTTKTGSIAALSHTASLAGDAEVYRGAFKQANCIIAKSFEEFVDLAEIFAKSPKASGSRIAVITNSGGHAILVSDAIDHHKLPLAQFSSKIKDQLKKSLAPVPIRNPLDLLGDATAERYRIALDACINDPNIDIILLMCMPQTPLIQVKELLTVIENAKNISKKPIICVTSGSTFAEQLKLAIEKMGLPCYHFPEEAVRSIAKFVDYYKK